MKELYCGRIVSIFCTPNGIIGAAYRVSSRSFPNRTMRILPDGASVEPRDPAETMKNPYIAYRCIRYGGEVAVASNGHHTDAVYERMAAGTPPRDAIALSLLAYDYEHDQLNTPRIVAAVRRGDRNGYLGVVRADGIQVEAVPLSPGEVHVLATYELDRIGGPGQCADFRLEDVNGIVQGLFLESPFKELLKPVCGSCVIEGPAGYAVAAGDAPPQPS